MSSTTTLHADSPRNSPMPSVFLPGQSDIWFFVFFEAFLFTSYFTVYMVRRVLESDAFLISQAQLSLTTGLVNTLVLLVSSWSMARCVQAAREGSLQTAMHNALLTVGFGLAFAVVKISEWVVEIGKGYSFTTDEFFSFYYFLTSIHFIHLLIGFVFLAVAVNQVRRPAPSLPVIETCAVYWHMVDFVWILIFALLYLMR
jgi:nitric oxide reductase NorE protein